MSTSTLRRPRVLVLTQFYAPEPNFITADVSEALARDADVTVVTAHPNYPFGRFYSGTRFWRIEKSVVNGVAIWRVPFVPDNSLSPIRRTISYLSFAAMAGIVAPFVAGRPDTVWVYHGPFNTGMCALFFKFFHRSRLVFTCADLWPESLRAAGVVKSPLVMAAAAAYNRALSRLADMIICATRGTLRHFEEEGLPSERLAFIPVWIGGTAELARGITRQNGDGTKIVYAGNLGPAQGIETLILAAATLGSEGIPVHFDIYGTGPSEAELRALVVRSGAANVTFHGRVAVEQAFRASASALAQIICLRPSPLFARTVPSKLFAALAAGSPILYALEGEAAEIAADTGGGIAFTAGNPASLVMAIKQLLSLHPDERERMRSSLRTHFFANFDPSLLLSRYIDILHVPKSSSPELSSEERTRECQVLGY